MNTWNKNELLKGIRDEEEKLLFAKALDQAASAMKWYEPRFSDFMDTAKACRFMERFRHLQGLSVIAFGGTENCERLMLGFAPENVAFSEGNFPIAALGIKLKNKKFAQSDLSHRDYLGSLVGLGIDRSKTGDILLSEEGAVCFVEEEMAGFISSSLERVSRTPVLVEECEKNTIFVPKRTEVRRLTVAAMRLDAVLGEVCHLSRGKAQTLITGEKVQVNWSVVTNTSTLLKEGDMVSARGFGRFRVAEIHGKTKKDRISLEVEIYI